MKAFYFAPNNKRLRYGDDRKIEVGSKHTTHRAQSAKIQGVDFFCLQQAIKFSFIECAAVGFNDHRVTFLYFQALGKLKLRCSRFRAPLFTGVINPYYREFILPEKPDCPSHHFKSIFLVILRHHREIFVLYIDHEQCRDQHFFFFLGITYSDKECHNEYAKRKFFHGYSINNIKILLKFHNITN